MVSCRFGSPFALFLSGRQSKQGLILAAMSRKGRKSLAENWLTCLEKLAQEPMGKSPAAACLLQKEVV